MHFKTISAYTLYALIIFTATYPKNAPVQPQIVHKQPYVTAAYAQGLKEHTALSGFFWAGLVPYFLPRSTYTQVAQLCLALFNGFSIVDLYALYNDNQTLDTASWRGKRDALIVRALINGVYLLGRK